MEARILHISVPHICRSMVAGFWVAGLKQDAQSHSLQCCRPVERDRVVGHSSGHRWVRKGAASRVLAGSALGP